MISAARGLWPSPRPSRIPAAIAITFLSAPASSTPITSPSGVHPERGCREHLLRVERRGGVGRGRHHRRGLALAHFRGEARPRERHEPRLRHALANTSDMSASVSLSMPLVALIISVPRGTASATRRSTERTAWLGGADTITDAPGNAARGSDSARERRGERYAAQEERVLAVAVDRGDHLRLEGPDLHPRALPRQGGLPAWCPSFRRPARRSPLIDCRWAPRGARSGSPFP